MIILTETLHRSNSETSPEHSLQWYVTSSWSWHPNDLSKIRYKSALAWINVIYVPYKISICLIMFFLSHLFTAHGSGTGCIIMENIITLNCIRQQTFKFLMQYESQTSPCAAIIKAISKLKISCSHIARLYNIIGIVYGPWIFQKALQIILFFFPFSHRKAHTSEVIREKVKKTHQAIPVICICNI